ncbi:LysR family transcriptional regulator [Kiloniella sp. b19]|uniref:LysR family transcriptional regulator n=1 Tax=Kiloniella sp. GXU_MW_B19 TaxID=3141326 RepID=UPI0031D92D39
MHKTDNLSLDGHLLKLFVLICDTGSVSGAARHLGINQSSASHGLERLRRITGDPLFVRSGRGIVPTERAERLLLQARELLTGIDSFAEADSYDPLTDQGAFKIAANDFEVETILGPLLEILQREAPGVQLHILRSNGRNDWIPLLRDGLADLVLAPRLSGDYSDLAQQVLFEDHQVCVYSGNRKDVPDNPESYCAAVHAVMFSGQNPRTEIDRLLEKQGKSRRIGLVCPSFSMLAGLMRGTEMIATMPSRLTNTVFAGFESVAAPVDIPAFSIAQIWHTRNRVSARHRWLRARIRGLFHHVN